ncbi:MAG: hypothetical protein GFH27_549349n93 [Chloroflexi bacterium AL-W]|nr:hypothetical protein [Chloroflexi bacterium AL-N1]NOK69991.1 hypothetical protein [Chloroflexi bacterium AL-N10]NOK73711.1 hypothetical protein [Chloroflexi bacterium AL-N5]NOK85523.1 hypothetical protein [Chloroflexi bacterium AL-W]NOK91724.1 hypothetical protein [Chloroflexi bacterium AL-N15]
MTQTTQTSFRTVDIERPGYGRRYTGLFVDEVNRQGFSIDFTDMYTRPEMIDIQPGDTVRWKDGERLVTGDIVAVQREDNKLHAVTENIVLLPPDAFFS